MGLEPDGLVRNEESTARSPRGGVRLGWALAALVLLGARPSEAQVTNYRSIGSAFSITGTVSATNGSTNVTGAGTSWLTSNHGRGDVITIPCDPPLCIGGVRYRVTGVTGEGTLTIDPPYAGATDTGLTYLLQRAHASLGEWEDCIDGPGGTPCALGMSVSSNSLVADNRIEVGIAYDDGVFSLTSPVDIDGSTTDASHTITLTADPGNRHLGLALGGVLVHNQTNTGPAIRVRDDHVTLEWLEVRGGTGTGAAAVQSDNQATGNKLVLRSLLLHDTGGPAIEIRDADTVADVYNNVVYRTQAGIVLTNGGATVRILNNTVHDTTVGAGIGSSAGTNAGVTLRNNIAHSSAPDFAVPSPNAASSHNLSSDTTAPGASSLTSQPLSNVDFVDTTAGQENLHILQTSTAFQAGADLSGLFTTDVDATTRSAPWDIGADEVQTIAIDLAVTKTDGLTTAVPGQAVTYTIQVRNNGPGTLTSLTLIDPAASLLSPAWTTPDGSYDDSTDAWTGLTLNSGGTITLTLTGTIDPFARGSLASSATVTPPLGYSDPSSGNNTAVDTDLLDPAADVAIAKSDDLDPAALGGLLTYTLSVTNNGPSGATGVTTSDRLPVDMELDGPGAIVPSQGSCSYDVPTRTVDCTLGNIAPGSGATVAIQVRPQALGTYTNTASASRVEVDPAGGNDSDNETTQVQRSSLGVRSFTATSTNLRNVLEWENPNDAAYVSTQIVVRGDRFPTNPADGASLYNSGAGGPGGRVKLPHSPGALSNGQNFYYGAFVHRSAPPLVSPGRFVIGRPFDHTASAVKWAFATGASALAAPTVGGAGVIGTSNDDLVYAMQRGADDDQAGIDSGEWPASFRPIELGGPVQLRSAVVPITVGGASSVVYLGAQDGKVYVVDAVQGGASGFPWAPAAIGTMVQAAPAGIFGAFGSSLDYLLVGTRNAGSPNAFVAINPFTGAEIERWDGGGAGPGEIGIVNGMAAVDYGPPARVYFTSYERTPVGSTNTLRCFELKEAPDPVFNLVWARALGNIDSSPVLRNGRVYVGGPQGGGTLHSLDAATGADDRVFVHGNGQVKGFVFPDRASGDVYFATDDFVWGVTDTGIALTNKFGSGVSLGGGVRPSAVLFVPGSQFLYVGGSDGKLYELDVLGAPGIKAVTLGDGRAVAGAPSFDRENGLVHVGSLAGIFYAVRVPLP